MEQQLEKKEKGKGGRKEKRGRREGKEEKKKEGIETKEANLGKNRGELSIRGHSYDAQTIEQANKLLIDFGSLLLILPSN